MVIFDQGDETNDTHYFRISTTPNGIHMGWGLEYVTDDRGDTLVTYEGEPADLDNIILETGTNGGGILLYEDETEIGYEIAPRVIFMYHQILLVNHYTTIVIITQEWVVTFQYLMSHLIWYWIMEIQTPQIQALIK